MDKKVTIFQLGWFGLTKTEAKLIEHGRKKYAQYDAAPFAVFVPKGKRKARWYVEGYRPYLVIADGWGLPDPKDALEPAGPGMKVTRKLSCAEGWRTEADEFIKTLPKEAILADYREGH